VRTGRGGKRASQASACLRVRTAANGMERSTSGMAVGLCMSADQVASTRRRSQGATTGSRGGHLLRTAKQWRQKQHNKCIHAPQVCRVCAVAAASTSRRKKAVTHPRTWAMPVKESNTGASPSSAAVSASALWPRCRASNLPSARTTPPPVAGKAHRKARQREFSRCLATQACCVFRRRSVVLAHQVAEMELCHRSRLSVAPVVMLLWTPKLLGADGGDRGHDGGDMRCKATHDVQLCRWRRRASEREAIYL